MQAFEVIGIVSATLAVIGLVAFLVFRAEVRKEARPRRRSLHDTAYGKDVTFTGAGDPAFRCKRTLSGDGFEGLDGRGGVD